MIVVTTFPTRQVNDSASLTSKWSAVHHPIVFGACRRDVKVVQVQYLNGIFRAILQSVPADLEVGQICHLVSGTTNAQVVVTGIQGNQISMTGNIAPVSYGGYLNLTAARRNYLAEVRIMGVNNANQYYEVGVIETKPAPDGTFSFDVAGFLKTIAEMTDSFLYNQLNKKIVGAGSRFNIQWRESWVDFQGEYTSLSPTNVFYWTNATKQLQQRYNFNVGEHVIFPSINTAKFLCGFDRPTYFPGFPFSLSFIWSDKISGHLISKVEEGFDDNGTLSLSTEYDLDGSQSLAVNRLMLEDPAGYTGITFLEVWLISSGLQPVQWVKPGYVLSGYVEGIPSLPAIKER